MYFAGTMLKDVLHFQYYSATGHLDLLCVDTSVFHASNSRVASSKLLVALCLDIAVFSLN